MANGDANKTAVTIVGILAILVLVGLAVYFVTEEANDSGIEIDLGAASALVMPAEAGEAAPPRGFWWAA